MEAASPYLSLLSSAEQHYGLPRGLLVRVAWQESSFRPEVINGSVRSPAGAVGMFQLMPEYFPNAGISTAVDASTAAQLLASLYKRFGDWQMALAAYNWGQGNVHHAIVTDGAPTLADLPLETQNYVADIIADVPLPGCLVPIQGMMA